MGMDGLDVDGGGRRQFENPPNPKIDDARSQSSKESLFIFCRSSTFKCLVSIIFSTFSNISAWGFPADISSNAPGTVVNLMHFEEFEPIVSHQGRLPTGRPGLH